MLIKLHHPSPYNQRCALFTDLRLGGAACEWLSALRNRNYTAPVHFLLIGQAVLKAVFVIQCSKCYRHSPYGTWITKQDSLDSKRQGDIRLSVILETAIYRIIRTMLPESASHSSADKTASALLDCGLLQYSLSPKSWPGKIMAYRISVTNLCRCCRLDCIATNTATQPLEQQHKPLVKICGVVSKSDAELAGQAGADFIGMIMWPRARRSVSLEIAAEISETARTHGAEPVGVFVDEDFADIVRCCKQTGIGFAQLHGKGARAALPDLPAWLKVLCRATNVATIRVSSLVSLEQTAWVLQKDKQNPYKVIV